MSINSIPLEQPFSCDHNGATTVLIVLSSITIAVATGLVVSRLYLRIWLVPSFWWDDLLILIAYLLLVPYLSLLWRMVDRGLGIRVQCVSQANILDVLDLETIAEFFQILSTMLSRASVAFFAMRLFDTPKFMRISLYGWTAFMCASMIVTAVLTFTVCSPVKALWHDRSIPIQDCFSKPGLEFRNWYNGIIGILSDLMLALLPVYFLFALESLVWRQRVALSALTVLGMIPTGCCLTRLVLQQNIDDQQPLASFAKVALFGAIEASTLIVCACVPALWPLVLDVFRRRLSALRKPSVAKESESSSIRDTILRPLTSHEVRVTRSWFVRTTPRDTTRPSVSDELTEYEQRRISPFLPENDNTGE